MQAYRNYSILVVTAVVLLITSFIFLPLIPTSAVFAASLPWRSDTTTDLFRCYVDADASGFIHDGRSWSKAYKDLQFALTDRECTEIWVAEGTYKPTKGTDRSATFSLHTGIELYGGFSGTETLLEQRNWSAHPTILSGDIRTAQNPDDYSFHVVTVTDSYSETPVVVDGFTITSGRAEMIGTLDVVGGGMVSYTSHIDLTNVIFSGNYAFTNGGGLYADGSYVTLLNVSFIDNTAGGNGGGMVNLNSNATLVDVLFSGNTAGGNGGGIAIFNSIGLNSNLLTNTTFYGNGANRGGGISADNSAVFITNTILWGNTAVSTNPQMSFVNNSLPHVAHVLVQGGCPGGVQCEDLITTNPRFVDAPAGNFRLLADSPAINRGINYAGGLHYVTVDLDGNPRIVGENVDLGVYEFMGRCYVKWNATGDNTGLSWTDAFTHISSAMPYTYCDEIWVAEGTYKPILKPTDTDRTATFGLRNGMAVYGGFVGNETQLSQRLWKEHPTILSGEIGTAGAFDNSYHVVTAMNLDPETTMDGFTISGGYADEPGAPAEGGGMKAIASKMHLDNITFEDNYAFFGGGLNAVAGSTDLNNVTFRRNTAAQDGGGMNISGGRAWMVDSTFIDNTTIYYGGGMNINGADTLHMVNALFSRNKAAWGGGMAVVSAAGGDEFILVNGTFSSNHAYAAGGGVYGSGIAANLHNTILWGNTATGDGPQIYSYSVTKPSLFYSLVQGGCNAAWFTCDTNVISGDPRFMNAGEDDLHLLTGSPAIDAGNHEALFLLVTKDMDGKPRVMGSDVDLGPYESYVFVNLPLLLK